ncbi:MAG: HAMP domain-containing histidine kinase, partial [Cytophagales bacterium]|nr:HAMP domain-containing histidine kinase [Cytophagales bacterium]
DRFIADILDYSRNARFEAKREIVDLEEEVDETVRQYGFLEGAAEVAVTTLVEQSKEFHTDRYRLRVILNNLVSNAYRYQNPTQTQKWINISCKVSNGHAVIKVRDNGLGISAEDRPRIFDMFYRASNSLSGSGLGLYIAKESAAKIGGTIRVVSEENRFTEFTVEIPNQA